MENRNNALHYKMYKSGKNIVYAGLATTAVLAGLTLANANNTADASTLVSATTTEQTAATSAATPATSAEIASQQSVVNSASANVASQQAVVNANSAALTSAQNLNSASAAVSDAVAKHNAAYDAYQAALSAEAKAATASQKAASAASSAKPYADWWAAQGETVLKGIKDNQTALDDANAQLPAVKAAWSAASDAYDDALSNGNVTATQLDSLKHQKELAYNNLTAVNNAITTAKQTLKRWQNMLEGKGNANLSYPYEAAKKIVDSYPALKKAAADAHQAWLDAKQAAADAKTVSDQTWNNIAAVRRNVNLPASETSPLYNELKNNAESVKGGFELSFYGGLKLYDLGGLGIDRCQTV